jgi:hypothetical protein
MPRLFSPKASSSSGSSPSAWPSPAPPAPRASPRSWRGPPRFTRRTLATARSRTCPSSIDWIVSIHQSIHPSIHPSIHCIPPPTKQNSPADKWQALFRATREHCAALEVGNGLWLIVELLTPGRNFFGVMLFWQFLQMRWMLDQEGVVKVRRGCAYVCVYRVVIIVVSTPPFPPIPPENKSLQGQVQGTRLEAPLPDATPPLPRARSDALWPRPRLLPAGRADAGPAAGAGAAAGGGGGFGGDDAAVLGDVGYCCSGGGHEISRHEGGSILYVCVLLRVRVDETTNKERTKEKQSNKKPQHAQHAQRRFVFFPRRCCVLIALQDARVYVMYVMEKRNKLLLLLQTLALSLQKGGTGFSQAHKAGPPFPPL